MLPSTFNNLFDVAFINYRQFKMFAIDDMLSPEVLAAILKIFTINIYLGKLPININILSTT